jgi:hypothetical protein
MLLLSVYAPVQGHAAQLERAQFNAAFMELVHGFYMQTPTILLGDWNGSACPSRDYQGASGRSRPACALLTHLLGPGAPWVDVQLALLGEVPWTFNHMDGFGNVAASRIVLILANHAALALVVSTEVVVGIQDGATPQSWWSCVCVALWVSIC